jgi:dTDP-4-amino-4,6-dideoxygalactose transaminase
LKPIYVTKSVLPSLKHYNKYLKKIWGNGILTNDGPLLSELERRLRKISGSEYVMCLANGTLALQLALRALEIRGEVITTPFSFIATLSSVLWENCKPVYADIDSQTLNIDPAEIEKKITRNTSAILAVHVYGNPCDVDEIERISSRYNLKVIYDASHSINIKYKGKPLFNYGDISTTSLHATKIINTAEGGAIFTNNKEVAQKVKLLRNFGYRNYKILELGINAKMNEFSAALGLANLENLGKIIKRRKRVFDSYRRYLKGNGKITYQKFLSEQNYAYYPVIFLTEKLKKKVIRELNSRNIYPREYFYPSLELVFGSKITCPVAYDISRRILCLPISPYLKETDVRLIAGIVNKVCGN